MLLGKFKKFFLHIFTQGIFLFLHLSIITFYFHFLSFLSLDEIAISSIILAAALTGLFTLSMKEILIYRTGMYNNV